MDNFLPVARTKQKPPFQLERGFFEMQRSDDDCSWMMAISAASHRRRVLHIPRFAPQGQSLLIQPLLLSPEKPLRWVFPGAPFLSACSISCASPRRGKAYSFRRSSFPQKNRFAGFARGPRSFPRAPYPALRPTGAKLTHSAAPPLPRKTASLGFPGGPVISRRGETKTPVPTGTGFFEMQRSDDYTSWMMAISAASPRRGPMRTMRV